MWITTKEEPIKYNKVHRCKYCGDIGSYNVFYTYQVLTLFFIPVWKWNRTYFADATCCRKKFILDKIIGDMLRHGDDVEIAENDLSEIY
jgi:hypothetical protein